MPNIDVLCPSAPALRSLCRPWLKDVCENAAPLERVKGR
jgi:hypothetical protein